MNIQTPVPTVYGSWQEKFGEIWSRVLERLDGAHAGVIEEVRLPKTHPVDLPTVFLKKDGSLEVLRFLRDECGFSFLTDYTATDESSGESTGETSEDKRFHLVIHLMNPADKARLRLKIRIGEKESMPTLIDLWPGANWAEREIFDMFGILFEGHPDLRRILMDVRWEGHPLRKDYPLRGYQVFLTPEPIDPELFK